MCYEPGWSGHAAEGPAQDRFVRAREHQGIVYNSCSRLYVGDIVPGEGSPGGYSQGKACCRPVIDSYCAVAEVSNRTFDCRSYCRVFERCGVDDDGGVQRTPQALIGEGNGAVDVLGDICSVDG